MIKVFCDGGSRGNPGPAASAFVIKNQAGTVIYKAGKFLGVATNNQAEYLGVVFALEYLSTKQDLVKEEINFYLDTILVVSQINGLFKIKNAGLRNLLFKVRQLESEIKGRIIYSQIPREKNYDADLLVNQTLDSRK